MKNFAVIYLVDISEVPDFNAMYELYDPCTVMFFFRNKVSRVFFRNKVFFRNEVILWFSRECGAGPAAGVRDGHGKRWLQKLCAVPACLAMQR